MGIRVFNKDGKRYTQNHIMLYVGEGYIIHTTQGKSKGFTEIVIEENSYFSKVIKEKLISQEKLEEKKFLYIITNTALQIDIINKR